jgi:DNA-binding NarL/FixJ family response regulator
MTTASATELTPAVMAIVGDDADARRAVAAQLRTAGFGVAAAAADDLGRAAGGIVVVLTSGSDAERLAAVRAVASSRPEAAILAVMPASAPNAWLRRTLIAGAAGIVLEEELERALVPTAHALLAGQVAVPAVLARQLAPRPLSHREKQILSLVVRGLTNREIAHKLFLAESTVKTHLSSAFRKIDARSRSEAVARIQDPDGGYGPGILALADDGAA